MQDPLTFEQAVDFAVGSIDSAWSGWAAYSTVALGVLGAVAATLKTQFSTTEFRWALSIGFGIFALSNAIGLSNIFDDTSAFVDVAWALLPEGADPTLSAMLEQLEPFSRPLLWTYHGVLDAIVIAAIWLLPRASGSE